MQGKPLVAATAGAMLLSGRGETPVGGPFDPDPQSMWQTSGFLAFLLLTVVALGFTLRSGLRRRRRPHLRAALTTVGLLGVTVLFAFLMAEVRDFPAREMGIHRIFSRSSAYLVPALALTGWGLWRDPRWRWPHRICIGLFLIAVIGATGTGIWVLALSEPV